MGILLHESQAASWRQPGGLRQEYEQLQALVARQPAHVQTALGVQARAVAEALVEHAPQARFTLPERVVDTEGLSQVVPTGARAQVVTGNLVERLSGAGTSAAVRARLAELELAPDRGTSIAAALLRFSVATHMLRSMLPAGRSVVYAALPGEEIASIPVGGPGEPGPEALISAGDAIAEREQDTPADEPVVSPYVPAARRFYLPQWVAFDEHGRLLVNSLQVAEAYLASMQSFLAVLHASVALAPCVVADEEYQQKRNGMLGQIVNQGRALARYATRDIVETVRRRAESDSLNRGLRLSLPYFDDRLLELRVRDLEVIPAGRIMFVPAFVVRAAREEQGKVAQDTRLSPSTRKYLLGNLRTLEKTFLSASRKGAALSAGGASLPEVLGQETTVKE